MPVTPQDRPISSLREDTVDQLIMNYGHGKLSLEAFERRLDQALDTTSHETLVELTKDLDLTADKNYTERKKAELGIQNQRYDGGNDGHVDLMVNVFSGTNRSGAWRVASEIRLLNVFGGSNLDFSAARFSARTTHINMFCMFGGANFYVREGINVVSKALCIFGGIDNSAPSSNDPNAPTLVIQGFFLFGGVEIKIKKTAKERLIEFADSIKSMFNPAR